MVERYKLEEAHERDIRLMKQEAESETARINVRGQTQLKAHDEQAKEQQAALREEANERIKELEDVIEELEGKVLERDQRITELEEEAEAECDRLREESQQAIRKAREAQVRSHALTPPHTQPPCPLSSHTRTLAHLRSQQETDLKRETSRKLKEEIIDNDKLTVANLNRIKHLEALVDQHKSALDEAETENHELREQLVGAVDAKAAEEESSTLRELLAEREGQLLVMSRRLSDALDGIPERRHSSSSDFLHRFGLAGSRGIGAGA